MSQIRKARKARKKNKSLESLYSVEDWVVEQCAICCFPMREWCDDPCSLNEHYVLEIVILSCQHFFHKGCLLGALQANKTVPDLPGCPLCRRKFKEVPNLDTIRLKRTKCRYRKSLTNPKTSCSRPEAPNNMGFCRVHLPCLPGLTGGLREDLREDLREGLREGLTVHSDPEISLFNGELGNRKLLYMLRDSIVANNKCSYKYNNKNLKLYLKKARNHLVENPHESFENLIERLGSIDSRDRK